MLCAALVDGSTHDCPEIARGSMIAPVRMIAEQSVRTAAWKLSDEDGNFLGSVRHRYQVAVNAQRIAAVLAPGAEVEIVYRHARKGTVKKARES
jgi:hypothetical protein